MQKKTLIIIGLMLVLFFIIVSLSGCINQSPTASASASLTSGTVPLTISFMGSGSDSDGTVESYHWDFKDGQTSSQKNPVHTFTNSGTYAVTLTVTDNEGATGTDTVTITVSVLSNQSPTCSISALPSSGNAPLTVTFTMIASDADGSIASWALDINDDVTPEYSGSGMPPSTKEHIYQNLGTYTANLTVTDNNDAICTTTKIITISEEFNALPICVLSTSPSLQPLTKTFIMTATDPDGTITSWTLDIDDDGIPEYNGLGSPPAYKDYTYQDYGTYTAILTVTDNNGAICTTTKIITISNMQPICVLSTSPSLQPRTKTFIMTATDPDGTITSWTLDIDDDGTPEYSGSGTPPSTKEHIYQNLGTYTASLTVTDNNGAICTTTKIITISQ